MSVETFDLAEVVSVTPDAAAHFQKQLANKDAHAIRISLKESGCTGFMYVIDEIETGEPDDIKIVLTNGVELYVDPANVSAIQGTVIDYVKQGINRNLVLNNPNVKAACGCGDSFSV